MRNKALQFIPAFLLVCLLAVPETASARDRGHSGGFYGNNRPVVVHSYPYYWGSGWGAWNDPFWGGYYPYYYDNRGKVKIKDGNKYDQVYVNGAYAGTVEKMKNLRLDPGRYNIEVRNQGKPLVAQDVYVVTGKTVEIHVNGD